MALVNAPAPLARDRGPDALEAWPLIGTATSSADAFVGRKPLFAELGFDQVEQPTKGRAIMRLDLVAM